MLLMTTFYKPNSEAQNAVFLSMDRNTLHHQNGSLNFLQHIDFHSLMILQVPSNGKNFQTFLKIR